LESLWEFACAFLALTFSHLRVPFCLGEIRLGSRLDGASIGICILTGVLQMWHFEGALGGSCIHGSLTSLVQQKSDRENKTGADKYE